MLFHKVHIESIAHIDAPIRVTSRDLEARFSNTLERLGSRPGLIEALTGVVARRYFAEDSSPSIAATQAGRAALNKAGISPAEVGLVISTSVSKDYIEPSIASTVHGRLRLPETCLNFDVGNACLAFLDGMRIASNMIERGQIETALIVCGESAREPVEATVKRLSQPDATDQDLRDDFATLTLGSGGVAAVLRRSDMSNTAHRFLGGVTRAATEHNDLCKGTPERMTTDATGLLKAGVALAERTFAAARETLAWTPDIIDHTMMHQVGSIHASTILRTLGLAKESAFLIYPEFGNVGPASIPMALSKAADENRLKSGERIALLGIGSGLNCAMMEVVW